MNGSLTACALALIATVFGGLLLDACTRAEASARPVSRFADLAALARDFSSDGQRRIEASMDPAALALARRLDRGPHADLWGRPEGWASLDVSAAPTLGDWQITPQDAQALNALLPFAKDAAIPAAPFILPASGAERERALLCMTQAIYYEAALEPDAGQRAVAQTVLNRMRHPAFPKTVCGVVYQGSQQVTGCQFTFTCDGSLSRAPEPGHWARARAVAEQALSGYVMPSVGQATNYHADYVFPRWGPTLAKITQIGAHIFYRLPGAAGSPGAFNGRYAGGELAVNLAGPSQAAILAARAADAGPAPVVVAAVDPTTSDGLSHRPVGQVVAGRRVASRDEIARINASLAAFEAQGGPAATTP